MSSHEGITHDDDLAMYSDGLDPGDSMTTTARDPNEPTDDEIDRIGPEYATQAEITESIRDMVREMLLVRRGLEITEIIAGERANNIAMALIGTFEIKGRAAR